LAVLHPAVMQRWVRHCYFVNYYSLKVNLKRHCLFCSPVSHPKKGNMKIVVKAKFLHILFKILLRKFFVQTCSKRKTFTDEISRKSFSISLICHFRENLKKYFTVLPRQNFSSLKILFCTKLNKKTILGILIKCL
jgi:hypothetical protein